MFIIENLTVIIGAYAFKEGLIKITDALLITVNSYVVEDWKLLKNRCIFSNLLVDSHFYKKGTHTELLMQYMLITQREMSV